MGESEHAPQILITNVRSFVSQQQYLFDSLWGKSIPAKLRIREIEEGARREFIETIRDKHEIQRIAYELVKSAKREIQIISSTADAFHHLMITEFGILELLKDAAATTTATSSDDGLKIRVLVPLVDDKLKNKIVKLRQHPGIEIRDNKKPSQTKVITFIVDNDLSLTMEFKDDDLLQEEAYEEEVIKLAILSNSESTTLAYLSIFEMNWMHTEPLHKGDNNNNNNYVLR